MSEQITFDRRKGFVALPVEIMDLDLTPGAFRTLAELCRMANTDGFCWPSLHQLSERLGRSRAAVSGYIKELRVAGLVSTEEQRTANGYNYRLKYCVTFWQNWRAALSRRSPAESERSIHSAERLEESKNHIHENHSEGQDMSDLDRVLAQWAGCFAGAPYPLARRVPPADLLWKTDSLLSTPGTGKPVPAPLIRQKLSALWASLGLPEDCAAVTAQAEILTGMHLTAPELTALLSGLRRTWPAHWRRQPTADQFRKLVRGTGVTAHASKLAVLTRHRKRWQLAEKTLQKPRGSCSVAA